MKYYKWVWVAVLAVIFACGALAYPKALPVSARGEKNLMENIVSKGLGVPGKPDAKFLSAQTDFAVRLMQKSAQPGKNQLISPVSVSFALGMTANGAGGETLKQFETLLGGGMDVKELTRNYAREKRLFSPSASGKLILADSIWYRNRNLTVRKDFLQENADWFGTDAYQLDFSDPKAPGRINAWVKKNTDGKIEKIIEHISSRNNLLLINTLYLEQEWKIPYDNGSRPDIFHAPGGDKSIPMMSSTESYLSDDSAEGILKPLKDSRFAFAGILPKNGTGVDAYVKNLSGEAFSKLLKSGSGVAEATLPKFKFDCSSSLGEALSGMGLSDAFDKARADFSAMGSSSDGPLFIDGVLHKTYIQVDETGLKAGAATAAMMSGTSMPEHILVFDRPFLIAVVETQTGLPLFLGTVVDPKA